MAAVAAAAVATAEVAATTVCAAMAAAAAEAAATSAIVVMPNQSLIGGLMRIVYPHYQPTCATQISL